MVALKANEVDAFVARPSAERPIVLVCGPDAGLVHERAEKIINASVDDPNDPFALVRIEGDALAAEPSRLVEEAHTVPLFGGRRAVWVKAGSRNFAAAVEAVVASPPADCRIVIEAGDLRRTAPVRAICEKARCAAVLPCYADTERDLIRLVDDEMREAKLTIAPDARAALVSLIGGDRQASRSEIRKLALYAHGKDRVTLDDVVGGRRRLGAGARRRGGRSLRRSPARDRGAVLQGDGRRHVGRDDPILGAALRHAIAQGAFGA